MNKSENVENFLMGIEESKKIINPEESNDIGNKLFKKGNYHKAYQFYSRSLELTTDPEKWLTKENKERLGKYYSNRANSLIYMRDYSNTLLDANEAIQLRNGLKVITKAVALKNLEGNNEAMKILNKVKELKLKLTESEQKEIYSFMNLLISKQKVDNENEEEDKDNHEKMNISPLYPGPPKWNKNSSILNDLKIQIPMIDYFIDTYLSQREKDKRWNIYQQFQRLLIKNQ